MLTHSLFRSFQHRYPQSARYGIVLLLGFSLSSFSAIAVSDNPNQSAQTSDLRALKLNEPMEGELPGGEAQSFQITLTTLDFIRVQVTARGTDISITLFGPNGKPQVEYDPPQDSSNPTTVSLIAHYTGAYRLEIRSQEREKTAQPFTVKLAELRMVAKLDPERIAAELAFAQGEQFRGRESNEERRPAIAKYQEALQIWQTTGDRAEQAQALNSMGSVYNNLNDRDKAFTSFSQALEIRREIKDRAGEAASLNGIAQIYNTRGERQKALEMFQQVLQIRRELKDRRGEGGAMDAIAQVHLLLNERDQALKNYQEALKIRREVGDRRGEASTLTQLGVLSRRMGDYQQAFDYYNQSLQIYQSIGDRGGEAAATGSLGALFLFQGKRKEALSYLERAYEVQHALSQRRQESQTLHNIGSTYSDLGEQQKALDYLNRALRLRREITDRPGEASTLLMIGVVHNELGDKQLALDYFNQARPLLRSTGGPVQEAMAITVIGEVYSTLGDRQQALDYYQQALTLGREAKDPALQAAALRSIGLLYFSLGESQLATELFNQELEFRRKLGNPFEEASSLGNLGVVFSKLDEKEKALEYFDRALALAKDDRRITAITLIATTPIYHERDEHQKALDNLNRALSLAREIGDRLTEATALQNMGWQYLALKQQIQARDYLSQSLSIYRDIGDRNGQAGTLHLLALLEFDYGDLNTARERIEAALEIAESLRSNVASQELRASFFASVQKFYDLYVQILMKMHERNRSGSFDAMALQASERARARSLLDILTEAGANIRQGADPTLLEREQTLRQQLNAKASRQTQLLTSKAPAEQIETIGKEIQTLTAEYQQAQARIRVTSPRYAALTQPQPLSLKEIQNQVLDKDTLLLEYALGEKRSFLWAVTPTSLTSYTLPKRSEIQEAAREAYEFLIARNQSEPDETLARKNLREARADAQLVAATRKLSRMLLAPAAAQLGQKRLLIVAQDALQYLPFGILPRPGASRGKPGQVRTGNCPAGLAPCPLIIDHEIISLPSASTLAVLRREVAGREPASKTLAVFADPVFEKEDERVTKSPAPKENQSQPKPASTEQTRLFKHTASQLGSDRIPRLPFTRQEAERILALTPEAERKSALDFLASRSSVTAADLNQYRYIHFATHGLLNSEYPELSAIVLSLVDEKGQQQDGFLRAHEVYNLNMPAEVVVLSACETGLGKEIKGEGLVGLTRGFMYAGAPRVVVSLWSVNDRATAELMARFYRRMIKEGLRPAAALRAAQVEMSKQSQWQNPYYWAGFTLQGEWR